MRFYHFTVSNFVIFCMTSGMQYNVKIIWHFLCGSVKGVKAFRRVLRMSGELIYVLTLDLYTVSCSPTEIFPLDALVRYSQRMLPRHMCRDAKLCRIYVFLEWHTKSLGYPSVDLNTEQKFDVQSLGYQNYACSYRLLAKRQN